MIETTIPEINVAELMEQVRAKVSEAAKENRRASTNELPAKGLTIVSPKAIPPPPPLALPHPPPARKERVLALLGRAATSIAVNSWIPKPLRRFFRKQGDYNRALLESVSALAKANAELASRIEQLAACVEVQQGWLGEAHEKSAGNHRFVAEGIERLHEALQRRLDSNAEELADYASSLRKEVLQESQSLQQHHEELSKELKRLVAEGENNAEHLRNLQEDVEDRAAAALALRASHEELFKGIDNLRGDGERRGEHIRNLQREVERQAAAALSLQEGQENLVKGFRELRTNGERVGEHLRNLQTVATDAGRLAETGQQRLDGLEDRQTELARIYDRLDERLTAEAAFLRGHLSNQSSQIQRWIASKGNLKKPDFIDKPSTQAIEGRFDAFYLQFENRFRGSRNEIKERISFYLPYVWETVAGGAGHPILDLGCGRGEWLELLRDSGMEARGVDINSAMLDLCRERGLDAVQSDALQYLRSLPDNSQGAITGFHIIEHLPFEMLMDVFSEVQRVVEPGGFVIFESPNCKNLLVGACTFNVDPTHRNPVFPDTAKFMLELLGFHPVELEYLTPNVETPFDTEGAIHPVLKDLLYGPQDFAVIGFKPIEA